MKSVYWCPPQKKDSALQRLSCLIGCLIGCLSGCIPCSEGRVSPEFPSHRLLLDSTMFTYVRAHLLRFTDEQQLGAKMLLQHYL